jgi:hypothetical protein
MLAHLKQIQMEQKETMTFDEALEKLGISEYKQRIIHSNSHGELFNTHQYYSLAMLPLDKEVFSEWFRKVVKYAEEHWQRPESVFQHIFKIFNDNLHDTSKSNS